MAYPNVNEEWSSRSLMVDDDSGDRKQEVSASTSTFEKSSAPLEPGPSRRMGFLAILPGLLAVIVSWALATAMLAWLYSRRITDHPSSEDKFFRNALVAIEKAAAPKNNDDGSVMPESSLYGLTISSLSSTVIRITIPLLMTIFAFLVAADWLSAQDSGRTHALPTPAQYGMMVHMFSSTGLKTIYDYSSFFRRPSLAAAQPVAALKKCLFALIVLQVFNYGIIGGDLWLHSRTTSFIHRRVSPIPSDFLTSYALGSAINTTKCPGPIASIAGDETRDLPAGNAYNCQTLIFNPVGGGTANLNEWGNTEAVFGEAVSALRRSGLISNQIYLVGDLAIISRPNLDTDVDGAVFDTLAMKAQCKPANCSDVPSGPGQGSYICAEFSPAIEFGYDGTADADNHATRYNAADHSSLNASYPLDSNINPSGIVAIINYPTHQSTNQNRLGNSSTPGWLTSGGGNGGSSETFIAECTVTTYTVKVKLSNLPSQSFTLMSDPVMTDFNTTSAITPALETKTALSSAMMAYLSDVFQYSDVSDENAFVADFSRNLSVAALTLASPLVLNQPITEGSLVILQSASRYELAPLFFYTGLLYVYGFVALILCIFVAFTSSPTIMHGNEAVKTAELLKMRLTEPMVVIADQYVDKKGMEAGGKWSVEKNAQAMFDAAADDSARRLGAGHALKRRQTFGVQVLKDE
ncbi:hypothetical protein C8R43DRAFT_1125433 [Mycena crocata]|nr:hypothetical protein C8R43DRAFT_1125433 [Mycena crocata]